MPQRDSSDIVQIPVVIGLGGGRGVERMLVCPGVLLGWWKYSKITRGDD